MFFGESRDRHGKTAVGRTHPEQQLGKESGRKTLKEGKGASDPLAAPKGHRLGLHGHIFQPSEKSYINSFSLHLPLNVSTGRVCRAATSCSSTLPPQPGHYRSSFYREKSKETGANYLNNYLITLSTPSPPHLHSGTGAAETPTSSLSCDISCKALNPTTQGQKVLKLFGFKKLKASPAHSKLWDAGLLRIWFLEQSISQ